MAEAIRLDPLLSFGKESELGARGRGRVRRGSHTQETVYDNRRRKSRLMRMGIGGGKLRPGGGGAGRELRSHDYIPQHALGACAGRLGKCSPPRAPPYSLC